MFYNKIDMTTESNYPSPCKITCYSPAVPVDLDDYYKEYLKIEIFSNKEIKARVELYETRRCCGMLFLANLFSYDFGEGNAKKAVQCAIQAAKLGGYSAIQCVIPGDPIKINPTVLHIFKSAGFKLLRGSKVKNKRSENCLYTFQLEVK